MLIERGVIAREFAPELVPARMLGSSATAAGRSRTPPGTGLLLPLPGHEDRPPRLGVRAFRNDRFGLLFAGMLTCAPLSLTPTPRRSGDSPARRSSSTAAPMAVALNGGAAVRHGARRALHPRTWTGDDERCLVDLLGLGRRRSHRRPRPIPRIVRRTSGSRSTVARRCTGAAVHVLEARHLWIDFLGIRDAFMREHGSDYFENSRQATYVDQEYARRNPLEFRRLQQNTAGG